MRSCDGLRLVLLVLVVKLALCAVEKKKQEKAREKKEQRRVRLYSRTNSIAGLSTIVDIADVVVVRTVELVELTPFLEMEYHSSPELLLVTFFTSAVTEQPVRPLCPIPAPVHILRRSYHEYKLIIKIECNHT